MVSLIGVDDSSSGGACDRQNFTIPLVSISTNTDAKLLVRQCSRYTLHIARLKDDLEVNYRRAGHYHCRCGRMRTRSL